MGRAESLENPFQMLLFFEKCVGDEELGFDERSWMGMGMGMLMFDGDVGEGRSECESGEGVVKLSRMEMSAGGEGGEGQRWFSYNRVNWSDE